MFYYYLRIVYLFEIQQENMESDSIDISEIKSGIYIIKLNTNKKEIISEKIIVQ